MRIKYEACKYGFCVPLTFRQWVLTVGRTQFKFSINANLSGTGLVYFERYCGPIVWLAFFNGKICFGMVHYRKGALML